MTHWASALGHSVLQQLSLLYRALVWEGFILLAVASDEDRAIREEGTKSQASGSDSQSSTGTGSRSQSDSQSSKDRDFPADSQNPDSNLPLQTLLAIAHLSHRYRVLIAPHLNQWTPPPPPQQQPAVKQQITHLPQPSLQNRPQRQPPPAPPPPSWWSRSSSSPRSSASPPAWGAPWPS